MSHHVFLSKITAITGDYAKMKIILSIIILTVMYPFLGLFIEFIPNPMVPGGYLALNMTIPVIAGYFFGYRSGAFVGGVGTWIAAITDLSMFSALAIFPHIVMGTLAGWAGDNRNIILAALMLPVGHILNIVFFTRMGILAVPNGKAFESILGWAAETMIGILIIVLVLTVFSQWLYQTERW